MYIPTYTIQFLTNQIVEHSNQLVITRKHLVPANANIHPFILEALESLGRDYVYNLGKDFKKAESVHICFSPVEGLTGRSYTNERLRVFFENLTQNCIAIPKKEAQREGITHLKQRKATLEQQKEVQANFKGEKVLFLDQMAFALYNQNIKEACEIKLNIEEFVPLTQGGGLTTGMIRFPHLLKDFFTHFGDKKVSDQTKICIVGPGLYEGENTCASSPQFVELFSLFPRAQFVLLDNNAHAVKILSQQLLTCKFAAYDPLMLRMQTFPDPSVITRKAEYQPTFQKMKETLAEKALTPKNAKEMLDGIGKIQRMMIKVEPEKIEIREFDINHSPLHAEKDKFHIIVATMSIVNAIGDQIKQDPCVNIFDTFCKFLAALEEDGVLYIDTHLVKLIEHSYGLEGMALGISFLEAKLGNRLRFEEVSIQDFNPQVQGYQDTLPCFSIKDAEATKTHSLTSSSIHKIIRTNEKVIHSIEEREKINKKLLAMLQEKREWVL